MAASNTDLGTDGLPSATTGAPGWPVTFVEETLMRLRAQGDEQGLRIEPSSKEKADEEWRLAVSALRKLQERLAGLTQVRDFAFSRDGAEISVKVEDASKRGYSYFVLARHHPTKPNAPRGQIWLCNVGMDDTAFGDAVSAMMELVKRIARLLP